jgi:hypothetical protein
MRKAKAILSTILETLFEPVGAFQVKTWLLGRSMALRGSRQQRERVGHILLIYALPSWQFTTKKDITAIVGRAA